MDFVDVIGKSGQDGVDDAGQTEWVGESVFVSAMTCHSAI